MIRVVVYCSSVSITGFTVSGHADAAPRGQDIVCAGVSSLTQAAVLGITQYLGHKAEVEVSPGYLSLRLDFADDKTSAVLETMLLGLTEIEKAYPSYLRIAEHTNRK